MSEVTFTPEQVKEIRRRIEVAERAALRPSVEAILAAFPLPKVTRYRTFMYDGYLRRLRNDTMEHELEDGWYQSIGMSYDEWAKHLAKRGRWKDLAVFADIVARPTEEVDP